MRMTKMADCCGISIIHHLDEGWGLYDYDKAYDMRIGSAGEAKLMKLLYKYLKKAKYNDNRAYVMANYASIQETIIKKCLEEIGFEVVKGPVRNPNTGNQITTYLFDLAKFESIKPL